MKLIKFGIAVFVILVSGCVFYDLDYHCHDEKGISFYLVKDGQVSYGKTNVDLSELKLEVSPFIKSNDIDFYDWSSQIFYLNKEVYKEPFSKRYFLVKSGFEPLFLGYFFPMYQSSIPDLPIVFASDNFFLPADVVGFESFGNSQGVAGISKNESFRLTLLKNGFYREGINVELLDVKKKNSSTIEYEYRIENRDISKIYLLDPDKMGSSLFHYYVNGVTFRKGNSYFFPENNISANPDSLNESWLCTLMPGSSLTRKVELTGFKSLPDGIATAYFRFSGPGVKIGQWRKHNGRIWLGSINSEKEISFR